MDIKSDISKLVSVFLEKKFNIKTNEIEIQNTKKDFQGDLTIVLFPFYKDLNKDQISSFGKDLGESLVSNSKNINSFNKAEHITSDLNLFQYKIEDILKDILDSPKSKFCYLTNVNNKKLIHYQKIYKKKKDLINQYIIKDFEILNKEINNNKLLCPVYFIIDPKNKIEKTEKLSKKEKKRQKYLNKQKNK